MAVFNKETRVKCRMKVLGNVIQFLSGYRKEKELNYKRQSRTYISSRFLLLLLMNGKVCFKE